VCKEKEGIEYKSISNFTVTMPHFQYLLPFESGEIISTLLFPLIKVGFKPLPNFVLNYMQIYFL
jgi:hypothetical protein